MNHELWNVAIEAPLTKPLAYLNNPKIEKLEKGMSVLVPLGSRKVLGVVLGPFGLNLQKDTKYKLKYIISTVDDRPKLPEPYLKWIEWLAEYYVYPIGQIFKTTFPPLKKSTRPHNKPVLPQNIKQSSFTLTKEQEAIFQKSINKKDFKLILSMASQAQAKQKST